MFRPRESYDQRLLQSWLTITPQPLALRYIQDLFGNCVGLARFEDRADTLSFESLVRLDHKPHPPACDADEVIGPEYTGAPFAYAAEDLPDLMRSIERGYADPGGVVDAWTRRFVRPVGPTPVLSLLSDMTRAIHETFAYQKRLDTGLQSPHETLARGSGACRDFAMLMMEAARSLGLAARFVSGYIYTPLDGPQETRVGGGHTHAWVRVYLPSCGWVEFDPTNGIVGGQDLIRVAVVRDPRQAVPLSGSWFGAAADYLSMEVEVRVDIESEPRTLERAA
jgi:transglutaminase-like putative cysteine protease